MKPYYLTPTLRVGQTDDGNNFTLEQEVEIQSKGKPPRKDWRHMGYYGDLRTVVKAAVKRHLMASEEELPVALREILTAIEVLVDQVGSPRLTVTL